MADAPDPLKNLETAARGVPPLGDLDLMAVVEMSQALSGEIVLHKLVERLMVLALEHTGAGRGLFLMCAGDEPHVEAMAVRGPTAVELRWTPLGPADRPESLFNHVMRSHDSVIVDDVLASNPFSADAYFAAARTRSALCMPLARQGELVAILYLENELAPHAFSAERIAFLRLLAAQAAISLENARLFADLTMRRDQELAEAANRAKGRLVANVSHEIRTPLNAILGFTDLTLESTLTDDQRRSLTTVKSAAQHLVAMVDDLLEFAKIEAGKIDLVATTFSLRAVVAEVLRADALRAHGKGLELVADVAPDVPRYVVGDALRLRQILVNLVNNAVKFTSAGEIVVAIEHGAGDRVEVTVRDTGIGIAPEKQALVFGAFEQGDASVARRFGGTGLGLAIASQLAGLMGGKLTVASEPGRGTTFSFSALLPPGHGEDAGGDASELPPGRRLLVIDDNASSRRLLERTLGGWGASPTAVADGTAGLAALRDAVRSGRPYDAAIVDAHMPGLDGLEVAAQIRADPALAAIPVVLLGSSERPARLRRLHELGRAAHVPKPIDPDELQRTLAASVRGGGDEARRRLRILVAEDNELNVELMRYLLGRRGHDIAIAVDGREALALHESTRFDALLLDIHLPHIDGFGVVREIRRRERDSGAHLHVIATTALGRREDREACFAAGVDDFLSKPISSASLTRALERVAREDRPALSLIDAAVLLAACDGDDDILGSIARALRSSLPGHVRAVSSAFAERDLARVSKAAHKLAGVVCSFSTVVGQLALELEDKAGRRDPDAVLDALVARLATLASDLAREVEEVTVERLQAGAAG